MVLYIPQGQSSVTLWVYGHKKSTELIDKSLKPLQKFYILWILKLIQSEINVHQHVRNIPIKHKMWIVATVCAMVGHSCATVAHSTSADSPLNLSFILPLSHILSCNYFTRIFYFFLPLTSFLPQQPTPRCSIFQSPPSPLKGSTLFYSLWTGISDNLHSS